MQVASVFASVEKSADITQKVREQPNGEGTAAKAEEKDVVAWREILQQEVVRGFQPFLCTKTRNLASRVKPRTTDPRQIALKLTRFTTRFVKLPNISTSSRSVRPTVLAGAIDE